MEYKEFSAKTIEDAVIKASIELETASDHIEYEVIEKGSTGILGLFGSRPAVIKARVKAEAAAEDIAPVKSAVKESVKKEKIENPEKIEKTAKPEKSAETAGMEAREKETVTEPKEESLPGPAEHKKETGSVDSAFIL